jgi:S-(hydroxymethyl)glutathione dehydrogenase / alcohol dehydrogenase
MVRDLVRSSWMDLEGPREGKVLVEMKATGVCHTDEFTLSGADPEGLLPAILGHEGGRGCRCRQRCVGIEEGRSRYFALHAGMSSVPVLSFAQNKPLHVDPRNPRSGIDAGTSRFSIGKDKIHHYMDCSTFSNFTVLPEIALAKVDPNAQDFEQLRLARISAEAEEHLIAANR